MRVVGADAETLQDLEVLGDKVGCLARSSIPSMCAAGVGGLEGGGGWGVGDGEKYHFFLNKGGGGFERPGERRERERDSALSTFEGSHLLP